MSVLRGEEGGASFKVMLILLALFAVIHVGIKLVPMYMDAERMKDAMTQDARLAQTLKDEDIRKDLENEAKELDLPLDADDFVLNRNDDARHMAISATWDIEVHFFWGAYIRTFHFAPVIRESYTRRF